MSQKASRKSAVNEEKEKSSDTPVKEMKKKMAANAEKEKQAAEKITEKPAEKPEKTDKNAEKTDKSAEKTEKQDKSAEKVDKASEKNEKTDKKADKAEKKQDKQAEKKADTSAEKNEEKDVSKDDKSGKPDKPEKKAESKPKQNGKSSMNGSHSAEENGTQSKVLKLKEDIPTTDRKLRSADSPKPQESKKAESAKKQESPKKESKDGKQESETNQEEKENGEKTEKVEVDVVIEIDGDGEPRKTDTNYSKSRVKVSPYRRSIRTADQRTADQTTSSVMANYTGNNTTMEMDITETSSFVSLEEPSLEDSSYLSGLRSIRGRRSYKPLKEMTLRHLAANRSAKAATTPASDQPSRPTGTVVGRKRKPDSEDSIELASEASEVLTAAHSKRMRLLDRLTHSFRRTASSTPLPARRAAEIVGINTDLPLTAPVAAPASFDPESLKPAAAPAPLAQPASPLTPTDTDKDSKRCVVM